MLALAVQLEDFVRVHARLVDDVDPLIEESGVDELDLLGGQIDFGQDLSDIVGGDKATAAT